MPAFDPLDPHPVPELMGTARFRRKNTRSFHCVVGRSYRVDQMNPQATKDRGLVCKVLAIDGKHGAAKVSFPGTGRRGYAILYVADLVELDAQQDRQAGFPQNIAGAALK